MDYQSFRMPKNMKDWLVTNDGDYQPCLKVSIGWKKHGLIYLSKWWMMDNGD